MDRILKWRGGVEELDTRPIGVRLVLSRDAHDPSLWEARMTAIIASDAADRYETGRECS